MKYRSLFISFKYCKVILLILIINFATTIPFIKAVYADTQTEYESIIRDFPYYDDNTCESSGNSPNDPSNNPVVVIDPGHPGPGAIIEEPVPGHPTIITSTGYNPGETEDNFAVAQILEKKLLEKGYEVIMTKKTVKDRPSLVEVANMANNAKADIAVSIHYDSSAGNFGQWGEIYAQQNDLYRSNERDTDRVTFKNTDVAKKSQEYSKKIKESRNKYENDKVNITVNDSFNARADKMPGNISFVQLLSDVPWVYNESGGPLNSSSQEKYAKGVFEGIVAALPIGESEKESTEEGTVEGVDELNGFRLPVSKGYMGPEDPLKNGDTLYTDPVQGGKPATKEELKYYINMRWTWTTWSWNGDNKDIIDQKQKSWLQKSRPKIIATNTRTKKSVVLVPLDSGPGPWTGLQGGVTPYPSYWREGVYLKNDPAQYKGRVAGMPIDAWKAIDAKQLDYNIPGSGDILTYQFAKDQSIEVGPLDGSVDSGPGNSGGCKNGSGGSDDAGTGECEGGKDIVATALCLAWPFHKDPPGKYSGPDDAKKDAKPEFVAAQDKYNKVKGGGSNACIYADCGVFVATVMRTSGVDKQYPSVVTSTQLAYLQGNDDYVKIENKGNTSNLKPGDIFVYDGHTMLYVGNEGKGNSRQASLCEQTPNTSDIYFTGDGGTYSIYRRKK